MTIVLDGSSLTIEKVVAIARGNEKVELAPAALERIKACRAMLEEKLAAKEIMYGTNTGIGEFSEKILNDEQVKEFQRYLVYNHAAGIGDPAPVEHVRAALAGRINVHAHGNSGCRPEITLTLVEMLNKGVTPVVCQKGSVGASGDLAPMAQAALLLMGEGEAFFDGERLAGSEAMRRAGIPIPGLQARDGLATINGSNLLTAMSALHIYDMERFLKQAEIAAAMSIEALLGNLKPYNTKLHELRGFKGAVTSARNIMKVVEGSDLTTGKMKTKVQDAYSMRSTPQVIGAARDAVTYARSQVEIELNGVGDNPIFIPEDKLTLTGANFQGSPVSLPMDMAGAAVTMVCVLAERRLNRLTNPALSQGLPDFLAHEPGFYSGLMLSQYTADHLIVEQRILSAPASIQSIPAAADQEDFVSMGMNVALKNGQILDNAYGVLGIEFMAAAQALDFREFHPGKGTQAAREVIRKYVKHLDIDRPLFNDHNAMKALVKSGEILDEVEKTVGGLGA
ncbi:MAG: aromatic amino acid lyase [Anaerolineae bacterium CFX3]|jgi:histidine ammonia-lyase|nr:aromatic amino acid lyase [Anaerolineales bacterium]MCE7906306.1 aromatic amino acid lyase [Anaerolineae bacterium CFX3]MCQ3947530.1 phenylalanine ammonia-lyase [Anaerolineae bacterium]OQY83386.1 MAG: phenylalanine ammonia-lyase [Anaerolineae bacterium UTCFX3]RIK26429.1 MAG: phenylalanine ammonia-lyase [Anaerolineae bacterium]